MGMALASVGYCSAIELHLHEDKVLSFREAAIKKEMIFAFIFSLPN
jgi:hypothetical protein